MKLIIEIDNSIYDICKSVKNLPLDENDIMNSLIIQSIANGTPLTESDDCVSRETILNELSKWDWQNLYLPIHFKELIIDELPSVLPKGAR